jgi:hypothetical protein
MEIYVKKNLVVWTKTNYINSVVSVTYFLPYKNQEKKNRKIEKWKFKNKRGYTWRKPRTLPKLVDQYLKMHFH